MSDDTDRQEDATAADLSQHIATADDNLPLTVEEARARGFTFSVEEALTQYIAAGLERTPRTIQRYCGNGHLKARRAVAEFGEIFLIKPESVEHHIAYIMQVRPVATSRDVSQPVVMNEVTELKDESTSNSAATGDDHARQAPTTGDMSQDVATTEGRYVALLESENQFLRGQIAVKDEQIRGMGQHLEQSNILTAGLHKLLTPLLGRNSSSTSEERVHTYMPNNDVGDNSPAT